MNEANETCIECAMVLIEQDTWCKDHNGCWVCQQCYRDDVATGERHDHQEDR